jgi:hypothetical protein
MGAFCDLIAAKSKRAAEWIKERPLEARICNREGEIEVECLIRTGNFQQDHDGK